MRAHGRHGVSVLYRPVPKPIPEPDPPSSSAASASQSDDSSRATPAPADKQMSPRKARNESTRPYTKDFKILGTARHQCLLDHLRTDHL